MVFCENCHLPASKQCMGCKTVNYCSRTCQKAHWKAVHKLNCKSYEIVPILGKAMGIIANRDIKYGELIFKERPTLRFGSPTNCPIEIMMNLRNEFLKLSPSKLDEILQLEENHPTDPPLSTFDRFKKVVQKYTLDCRKYTTQSKDVGFFKDAGRINHSCFPNAERYFVDPWCRVYAIQDIAKGEEVSTDYFMEDYSHDVPPTIKNVKEHLLSNYGFECDCKLCRNSDLELQSEIVKHRVMCHQLRKDFFKCLLNPKTPEQTLKLCEDLLKQLTKAKCFSVYLRMTVGCQALKSVIQHFKLSLSEMKRKLKHYVQIVEENSSICEGADSAETVAKTVLAKNMLKDIDTMSESEYQSINQNFLQNF